LRLFDDFGEGHFELQGFWPTPRQRSAAYVSQRGRQLNIPAVSPTKIYSLTSIRFFAAALVLFHHSIPTFLPAVAKMDSTQMLQGSLNRGLLSFTTSVSFFFLLSGYVLGRMYLCKNNAVDIRSFWAARFARIYPMYFVMLVIDSQQLLRGELQAHGLMSALFKTSKIFVANALMMQAWDTSRLLRINVPSWSLSAEIFFYLCFPVLGGWLWKLRGKGLWMTALGIYVGGQTLVWIVRPHLAVQTLLSLPLLHLSTFAMGIVLARAQTLQELGRKGAEAPLRQVRLVLAGGVGGVLLSILMMPLFHVPGPYNNGLLTPAFAGIIWGLSAAKTSVSRWLCTGWLVALGNASYAIYLIHLPLQSLFVQFHWVGEWFYTLYLAVCLGLSVLSFYYFETPVRLRLLRWLHSRTVETMEVVTSVARASSPTSGGMRAS
jgi:peptidoglycan/LPS O-acetylase OafA/YrhL